MAYYTEKQIEQARSIDLLTYLQTYEPTELVHVRGNTYCTREHDSLKISNGKWMWWSRGFGGNSALDYLIKVKSMSFMDAMKALTEGASFLQHFDANICRKDGCERERKLLLPERADTNLEVIRYLSERGIDESILRDCIDEGMLYESLPYHNCIFVGYDEEGKAAYADKVAVVDGRIASLKNRISHCEAKALEIDKRRKGLKALKSKVASGHLMTEFDPLAFEEIVQNMVIGGYDEAGNVDPHCIMIVLKDGDKHLLTGRNYVPQRKNAAARRYPADYNDNAYVEVFSFNYYSQYFEFERNSTGLRKIPRGCVNVSVVVPINIEQSEEAKSTAA